MAAPSPSLQAAEATAQLVEGRDKELPLQAAAAAPRQALPPQPRAPPKAAQQEQQAGPVQNNWQPGDQQWQPLLRPGMEEQSSSAVGNGPGDPNPDGSDVCRKRTAAAEKHYRLLCSAEKALMEKQSEAGPSNTNNATLRTVRSLKERCRQHLGRAGLEDLPEEEPVDPLAARLRAQVSALRCLLSGLPLQGGHAGRSIPLRQPWGSDTNVNNAAEKRKQQEDLQEEHGRLYAAAAALAKVTTRPAPCPPRGLLPAPSTSHRDQHAQTEAPGATSA